MMIRITTKCFMPVSLQILYFYIASSKQKQIVGIKYNGRNMIMNIFDSMY
jgi:hypothetical protein